MADRKQWIALGGFFGTLAIVVYVVVGLNAQAPAGNFSEAQLAEVRDAQGQVILSGTFALVPEDDDDIERKATLAPTGIDPDASGEAEVEVPKAAGSAQEVEFSITNVHPDTTYTFLIDGQPVATAKADRKGKAEAEVETRPAK